MVYIFTAMGMMFRGLAKIKSFLPAIITGLFLLSSFLINAIKYSFAYAFSQMAKQVFAAELVINNNVQLAILNAPEYGLWQFLEIIFAIYILYQLVRFFIYIQLKLAGATSEWGAAMIGLLMVGIIEISAVKIIDGAFGFIPIWHGIIFLLINVVPVVTNLVGPAAEIIINPILTNMTENMTKV